MNYLPRKRPKLRMNVQPPDRVECRGHWEWMRKKGYLCLAAGKVSKRTGEIHVCEGRLDPHHAKTRGAGGDDRHIVPLCRCIHSRLDSPGHSQKSVEDEYGLKMLETSAALWREDTYHRQKFEREWREMWGDVPLPYESQLSEAPHGE
jgi:hypothetical protein